MSPLIPVCLIADTVLHWDGCDLVMCILLSAFVGACICGIILTKIDSKTVKAVYAAWQESAKRANDEALKFANEQFDLGFRAGHLRGTKEATARRDLTAFLAVDSATQKTRGN